MESHKPILVTGAAGFIGFHFARRLLEEGRPVVGLDNLNSYYDVRLKEGRLAQLKDHPGFQFYKVNIADREAMERVFREHSFDRVVHLAAQAGVRYSLTNPHAYVDSNLVGFLNILEGCRRHGVRHLVFASSSSVYGANTKMPFSAQDNVDHPVSLYAATKKANELMAHAYSHQYGLPCTGLRFFTVYGPWGRPDMALFIFTKSILEGKPIEVFNRGEMKRDFTYIDDIVEGIMRVLDSPPSRLTPAYKIYNIGRGQPIALTEFIAAIEEALGKKAEKKLAPLQTGDVVSTYADIEDLKNATGFSPETPIKTGIRNFVKWYLECYSAKQVTSQNGRQK